MSNPVNTPDALLTLIDIDKARYRKHLNTVIITFIACFAVLALLIGSGLIALFSSPDSNNFKLNLMGVVLALFICGGALSYFKKSVYFFEIYYVWRLKQVQNKIYRCLKKVKTLATSEQLDKKTTALALLYFYHSSLKFVYQLDDNTLTIDKVNSAISAVKQQALEAGITLSEPVFEPNMLKHLNSV